MKRALFLIVIATALLGCEKKEPVPVEQAKPSKPTLGELPKGGEPTFAKTTQPSK